MKKHMHLILFFTGLVLMTTAIGLWAAKAHDLARENAELKERLKVVKETAERWERVSVKWESNSNRFEEIAARHEQNADTAIKNTQEALALIDTLNAQIKALKDQSP